MKIEDLGYNSFFETSRIQLKLSNFPVARVVSQFKEAYRVKNERGEYLAKITGKQMFKASSLEDYPAIGDWVAITELDKEHAVIQGVLARLTAIKRNDQVIAANIDVVFAVESIGRDYNLNRFERYFSIAEQGGAKPAAILNKTDLIPKKELDEKLSQIKNRLPGIDIILTSTFTSQGLDDLKRYIIKGKTYCFLGSSGVGKSSLINRLIEKEEIKTGDISSYSNRGKHITTSRQMYFLESGGIVIDNPGMREVGMSETSLGIDSFFDQITSLAQKCKYADCTHIHEPGCQVLEAVKSGSLDKGKYSNYINLKKEAEFYQMNSAKKREKDRQFGKFLKKAKKEIENKD